MKQQPPSLLVLCLIFFLSGILSCTKNKGLLPQAKIKTLCDSLNVKFSTDINPIIQANCAVQGCHVSGGLGNGDFTTYNGISAKADAPVGNGALRKRALEGNPSWMPLGLGPLPLSQRQKIDCWLQSGAMNN